MTHLGATAYNGLMWSTDLALITSGHNHVFPQFSWTEADHLAKDSGRYLKRPGSLSGAKFYALYFFCIGINYFLIHINLP